MSDREQEQQDLDHDALQALIQRVVADRAGALVTALGYVGDRLGLFRAMAGAGPLTAGALAARTGLDARYVREWLHAMAAAEYLEHDPDADTFRMTAEQAAVLADPAARAYLGGVFQLPVATIRHMPAFLEVFRRGGGLSYETLGPEIIESHDRVHQPPFEHQLVPEWLGGVAGLPERLARGIRVLDVGAGLGRSSLAIARAYPRSHVTALEPDAHSAARARRLAAEAGAANLEVLETPVERLPEGARYDFILAFDCIHDMADPVGALRALRAALDPEGLVLWSELNASHNPLENRTPVRKMMAGISVFHCLTVSLAADGAGLGNLLGEAGVRRLAAEAGFASLERAPIEHPMQAFYVLRG